MVESCCCLAVGVLEDEPCVPKDEHTGIAHCTRVAVSGELLEKPDPPVCIKDDVEVDVDGKVELRKREGKLDVKVRKLDKLKIGKDECM